MTERWLLPGATRDRQSVTADWQPIGSELIDGVIVREVRSVLKGNGILTELFRRDWFGDAADVDQVFQVSLREGAVSAWHAHETTTDRLFVTRGTVRVVLYDGREGSPSFGRINEWLAGPERPLLIVVPPTVWHGVQNVSDELATVVNMPDKAYSYEHPDHWRLPPDTETVPYRFQGPATAGTLA